MPPAARVLVVDDERAITDLVEMALRYEGFVATTVASGEEALASLADWKPDVIVLDIGLPGIDGYAVLREVATLDDPPPVVFLTARDSTEDTIRGLMLGGDDYITKPFAMGELVARVRTVLRRRVTAQTTPRRLTVADVVLDLDTHDATRNGASVSLTPTEFRLLRHFFENPGRVLTRSQLLEQVWRYDFGGDASVLETYVGYLRRKLGEPLLLHTVRGIGYVLRVPA